MSRNCSAYPFGGLVNRIFSFERVDSNSGAFFSSPPVYPHEMGKVADENAFPESLLAVGSLERRDTRPPSSLGLLFTFSDHGTLLELEAIRTSCLPQVKLNGLSKHVSRAEDARVGPSQIAKAKSPRIRTGASSTPLEIGRQNDFGNPGSRSRTPLASGSSESSRFVDAAVATSILAALSHRGWRFSALPAGPELRWRARGTVDPSPSSTAPRMSNSIGHPLQDARGRFGLTGRRDVNARNTRSLDIMYDVYAEA